MKRSKTGILVIALIFSASLLGTFYFFAITRCELDGASICYDRDQEQFLIEDNASLTVQVENIELGDALITAWNELHPDYAGALSIEVAAPLTTDNLQEGLPYDVMVVSQNDAPYFIDQFLDLGDRLYSLLNTRVPYQVQSDINAQGYYFVQNSIDGWLFVYNETLMEELGFSLEDADGSGLPDVFESWEAIFDNAALIQEHIDYVFPFTFTDQPSFYPFLSGGRWTLNGSGNGSDPEFDSEAFLEGLTFIEALQQFPINRTHPDAAAEDLSWQYEAAFYQRQTLFSLADSWMFMDDYEELTQDRYVYAPFPTYQGNRLAPIASVDGYVVNGTVAYPSAAAEVMRLLRMGTVVSHYQSTAGKSLIYHRDFLDELSISDEKTLSRIRAYNFSDSLPVTALNTNPQVLSRSLYFEVDFMNILKNLYDGSITAEDAQQQIVAKARWWRGLYEEVEE